MAGPGDPPEGAPEGPAGGGEDEYRSVVFDESFIRAARLQEYSARERMGEHARAVRTRHAWSRHSGSRQAVLLVMLIALAFGTAIYLGVRHPYKAPEPLRAEQLRSTIVPLAPRDAVPGAGPADLFTHSPAAQFRIGAAGINLPAVDRTDHFSDGQIVTALSIVKDYLVRSSIDPATLTGGSVRPVRLLLDVGQLDQFDRSVERPADDGRHAATGWLVRFDPARVELADPGVRVDGALSVAETNADTLEIAADYTFVYAVRAVADGTRAARGADDGSDDGAVEEASGASATRTTALGTATASPVATLSSTAGTSPASSVAASAATTLPTAGERADRTGARPASLFTVRRQLRFRVDRDGLTDHRLQVVLSNLQAGPLACSPSPARELRPLLAGQRAGHDGPAGTDPYAHGRANTALCGVMAASAQPSPRHPVR
ncbi:hypothetical protein [Streptomyces sp. NPDC003077]|uniref:SCO2583 family membrane protein n=1 Tax=Streptomyces sp. NPDC003077 TaxID=3154443 RepID=UPI0033BB0249